MKSPILGSAYTSRSHILNAQRLINLYPEIVETQDGKAVGALYGCPGLDFIVTAGAGPIRGMLTNAAEMPLYVVSGDSLYEVSTGWAVTLRGTLNSSSGPVSIATNGTQVMIVDGDYGYIFTIATNTLAQITDPDFPGADTVGFIDQYFAFNEPGTGRWGVTALADGSSVDALDIVTSEGAPDNTIALLIDHREVWTFGTRSIEVWVPSTTDPDFPFERSQLIETGCGAKRTPAKLDNSVFWVDQDGITRRADGYIPKRVSTHAIERMITGLARIDDLESLVYSQEGHSFYQVTSPSGRITVVYDASTGLWHERAFRVAATNTLTRHRASAYAFFNRKHVVGDFENGNIYALDLDTFTDNGAARKWLRSWRALPEGQNPAKTLEMSRLQVDCEVGVGLVTGQGADPQMALRISRDGGRTWGNEVSRTMGQLGNYKRQIIWNRLGKAFDPVFEVSGTDPVKVALVGAHLEAELG